MFLLLAGYPANLSLETGRKVVSRERLLMGLSATVAFVSDPCTSLCGPRSPLRDGQICPLWMNDCQWSMTTGTEQRPAIRTCFRPHLVLHHFIYYLLKSRDNSQVEMWDNAGIREFYNTLLLLEACSWYVPAIELGTFLLFNFNRTSLSTTLGAWLIGLINPVNIKISDAQRGWINRTCQDLNFALHKVT